MLKCQTEKDHRLRRRHTLRKLWLRCLTVFHVIKRTRKWSFVGHRSGVGQALVCPHNYYNVIRLWSRLLSHFVYVMSTWTICHLPYKIYMVFWWEERDFKCSAYTRVMSSWTLCHFTLYDLQEVLITKKGFKVLNIFQSYVFLVVMSPHIIWSTRSFDYKKRL